MSRVAPSPAHIATLDVVRVVGAGMVLLYHYLFAAGLSAYPFAGTVEPNEALRHFYLGVHLFFMVSGFVIVASVDRRDAFAFAVARFTRLWPTFVLGVSLTATVLLLAGVPVEPSRWLANLLFVAPAFGEPFMDGVYWSIVVELVFYAWIAALLVVVRVERHVETIVLAWLAVALLNEAWLRDEIVRHAALTRFGPWFMMGMLLFAIRARGLSAARAALLLAVFLTSCGNAVDEQYDVASRVGLEPDIWGTLWSNVAIVAIFLLALAVRIAPRPWLLAAGASTYPFYLLHQEIGYVVLAKLAGPWGIATATIAVTVAIAAASLAVARWFDRPARRALARALDPVVSLIRSPFLRGTAGQA